MDSASTIKRPAGVSYAPTRASVRTDLSGTQSVTANAAVAPVRNDADHGEDQRRHDEHPARELLADPESREVLYRAADVRDQSHDAEEALLRQRAYRKPKPAHERGNDRDHADLET